MIILLYQPPCGIWYVHSHKGYPDHEAAYDAARKFLPPGTPIACIPVPMTQIERVETVVKS